MNIWKTIEVDCWSRGFNYVEYASYHNKAKEKGALLSPDAYDALCNIFEIEMENAFK